MTPDCGCGCTKKGREMLLRNELSAGTRPIFSAEFLHVSAEEQAAIEAARKIFFAAARKTK